MNLAGLSERTSLLLLYHCGRKSKRDLDTIISEEHLKPTETYQFIDDSFEQGEITTTGVGITRILPPMPVIGAKGKDQKKWIVKMFGNILSRIFGKRVHNIWRFAK